MKTKSCNQCNGYLENFVLTQRRKKELDAQIIYVCKNPACPNFSLIQIPLEDMKKI